MENILVVRDLSSVHLWRQRLRQLDWTWNLPPVQFQLPDFSVEQNETFSALAAGFQRACGCGSGSFLMSAAVVAMVAIFFLSGNGFSDISFWNVLTFVGIGVLAALLGKLLGLLWARWRLLRLASRLCRSIARENDYLESISI
jgi:hypothetical protein